MKLRHQSRQFFRCGTAQADASPRRPALCMPSTLVNHGVQYYCTVGRPPERGSASHVTHDQHPAGARRGSAGADPDIQPLHRTHREYIRHKTLSNATRRPCFDQFRPGVRHLLLTLTVEGVPADYASSAHFRTKAAYDTSVETSIYLDATPRGTSHGRRLYTYPCFRRWSRPVRIIALWASSCLTMRA